jgi:hypothetical protein
MSTMKRVRYLAALVSIAGSLALKPASATAATFENCSVDDETAAIEDANDQCVAMNQGYTCFNLLSCTYDEDDPNYWNSTFQCKKCGDEM